jgi:23S rRNA (cytosine1962-C5)-methyltransferase
LDDKKVVLKKAKEVPIKYKHHWIFSGAIQSASNYNDGDIMPVYTSGGEPLGHGYFNKSTSICGRMLNFDKEDPIISLKKNIVSALKLRSNLFNEAQTNCFRLINGEGDLIPGLVVDRYADTLVMQINTTGIDKLKDVITKTLIDELKDKINCIYEKSISSARKQDGLTPTQGFLFGKEKQKVEVIENGIKFSVDVVKGQKTGLFLDMRNMRSLIKEISNGKSVLNCFGYSGGFSLYALKGGAKKVVTVDISKDATASAIENFELNGLDHKNNKIITADVFDFLKSEKLDYDIVILDPPAFAKKKSDINNAQRGYKEINKTAISKMPKGSLLLTCSCSYYIDEEMFERILAGAGKDAGRTLKVISKHRLAQDHVINPCHKEFNYIKSLLIYVE